MKNLSVMCFLLAATALLQGQTPVPVPAENAAAPKLAKSTEPIATIIEAFRSHPIVAIGNVEFRGDEQSHNFQLSLIRDPRFIAVVNDIVVEFGNARYQGVMDRFVHGEPVPYDLLRQVWQNTTQIEYEWDLPIYEDFFRAVRAVNASLPRSRQLRVLLGDSPIDWDSVRTLEDLHKQMGDRDGNAVGVIRREVLEKGRRALVIYGSHHLVRRNTVVGAEDTWARGIIARLEKNNIATAFSILPETRRDLRDLQPDVASWPVPSLAVLRGTVLGSALWDPDPRHRPVRVEDQFDAILYVGLPSSMTMSKLSPMLCSDRGYMQMRLWRLNLVPAPPGASFSPANQLKDYCAHPNGYSEIADHDPAITALVQKTLREAAQGKVDPQSIAPESRERLVPFLEREGPRRLGPAGELESLVLLDDDNSSGTRVRRYRTVFASGLRIVWIVRVSSTGTIVSLDPQPE